MRRAVPADRHYGIPAVKTGLTRQPRRIAAGGRFHQVVSHPSLVEHAAQDRLSTRAAPAAGMGIHDHFVA